MSSRAALTSAMIRHSIYLNRFTQAEKRKILRSVISMYNSTQDMLSQASTEFQTSRSVQLITDIEAMAEVLSQSLKDTVLKDMSELANHEALFNRVLMDKTTKASIAAADEFVVNNYVFNKPLVRGKIRIADSLDMFSRAKANQILNTVHEGYLLGKTNIEIAKDLQSMKRFMVPRQTESLIRTVVNHTAGMAKLAVYEENSDIIDGYRIVATLDSRTSEYCMGRDGDIVFSELDLPPYHWNCRTTYVANIRPEYDILGEGFGSRTSLGEDGREDINVNMTYSGWLRTQSTEFQNEVLGEGRASLFRQGMSLDKFTDASGKLYTIDELRRQDSLSF